MRLIWDMSSSLGSSVNEGINPNDYPLQYVRVDDIIKMVSKFRQGALMAKFDVESTYCNLAAHPSDRYLIGMKWRSMCLQLTIKASKTDPFRKGCCLYIGLGCPPLCVSSAIMNYLPRRGQSPSPLFLLSNGQLLSQTLLTHWLKDFFAAAGIQGSFSSHSFRIGAATVAARMGVPDHLIQAVGRWNSDAYKLYIRTPAKALAQVTSLLSH